MKTRHFIYCVAVIAVLFSACRKIDNGQNGGESPQVRKAIFSGYAQKGPFTTGSSIMISELKSNLDQTGKVYSTTISDNLGSFEQKNIELISQFMELKADGFYFNEIQGQISLAPMTLYALADIETVNSANVNVLTHLEKPRVEYLVKQERKSFAAAKKQAQKEVLAIFGFEPSETSFEALDLTSDAKLLAVSCILQGYLSTGNMMELMGDISSDIKQDGKLDNMTLGSKLMNNAYSVNLLGSTIRENLIKKYDELGMSVNISDFESHIEKFIKSDLYPLTVSITYPATGKYGENILSDNVIEVNVETFNEPKEPCFYSLKADVPKGLSLKIVLKDGNWGYQITSPVNWDITTYDINNKTQKFTMKESGNPNDLAILFFNGTLSDDGHEYITIEYYENGAKTPTKVKKMKLIYP